MHVQIANWLLLSQRELNPYLTLTDYGFIFLKEESKMACSYCGREGHNVTTCPHCKERAPFSASRRKSKRCQCCGQYGYDIHTHHSRGRSVNSISAALDLCTDCHLQCGHEGDNRNPPIKPQVCRITGRKSYWCR